MSDHRQIERLPALEAFHRARGNDLRRYPSPDRDGDRLYPLAAPVAHPTFRIPRDATIFAIGSCFARNVEKALEKAGMRVLSRELDLGEVGEGIDDAGNFYNKYSIHSIVNEMRWALERDTFPGPDVLCRMGEDRYVDLQLGMARMDHDVETVMAFRHRYLDGMAQAAEADVVIVTLGYVETWYDRHLDLYLNVAPPAQVVARAPDRFEFRVLSYEDVLEGLEALHALLCRHRATPPKMLLTVSPVPLVATFREMDVLVANSYSKSVQRAALERFVSGRAGVDYFPSYEFVTLSSPEVAWSPKDYRHVADDLVKRIMGDVLLRYVEGAGGDASMALPGVLAAARQLAKLGRHEDLLALCAEHRALVDDKPPLMLFEATALFKLGRVAGSFDALAKLLERAPKRADVLERMIVLCRPLERPEAARELLGAHAERFPERGEFRAKVTWAAADAA